MEDGHKQISLQKWCQLLPQPFSFMNRAQLLGCLGVRVALAAPWSLIAWERTCHTGPITKQSPLIHLKPQAAFAEWDFKQ